MKKNLATDTESNFESILKQYPERIYESVINTTVYHDTRKIQLPKNSHNWKTEIYIINGDTIDVATLLQQHSLNPLVLNMASSYTPGGGWRKGCSAQEESLFYRSTYAMSLENCMNIDKSRKWTYPLPKYGAVVSPDIFIFRANAAQKFRYYKSQECNWIDFMAVSAIKNPKLTADNHFTKVDRQITADKIDGMCRLGVITNHDSLVLGAFGCGAYHNPPEDIANLFKEIINEKYVGQFKNITFAIINDKYKRRPHICNNLQIFENVFGDCQKI